MEDLLDKVRRLEAENDILRATVLKESLTYEEMYERVKNTPKPSNFSFKEYKESQPRTFSEMFGDNGEPLKESRTYEEIYSRSLRESKLKESNEGDIYARYIDLCQEGMTDREARFQLTEEFGPSEEDDDYATLIDYLEETMDVDNSYGDVYEEGDKLFESLMREAKEETPRQKAAKKAAADRKDTAKFNKEHKEMKRQNAEDKRRYKASTVKKTSQRSKDEYLAKKDKKND